MESTLSDHITSTGITNPADGLAVRLERLSLFQFKNYPSAALEFKGAFVCFLGKNGSGKTNLLDAIHYLSMCKSYFNATDSQNISIGLDQASITGEWMRGELPEHTTCALRKGQRKVFKRNHKEYDRLADHIGLLPSVMITPYDVELIHEGSEVRRKFMDAAISQVSRPYLDHLLSYNQALAQRNNLLKTMAQKHSFSAELLEPWDFQLVQHGERIFEYRKAFFAEFLPIFKEIYLYITEGKEQPGISYLADQEQMPLQQLLENSRQKDRVLERTGCGIHKDDLEFVLNEMSLKKFASQGQQKSFLISLKLAQLEYLRRQLKINPLLLLDDLYDKVDDGRVTRLLEWLKDHPAGQVFISDTHIDRIPDILRQMHISSENWHISNAVATKL